MSLNIMLSNLQKINAGKIVLVKIGAFYIAKGRDAVLLNKILKLKNTCLEKEICKVGFPVNSLNKYIEKLNELKYGYIVYNYDSNKNRLKIRDKGKRKLKKKIKYLKYEIKNGEMTSKDAKKYLAGHMGYIKIANVYNLTSKLFYIE